MNNKCHVKIEQGVNTHIYINGIELMGAFRFELSQDAGDIPVVGIFLRPDGIEMELSNVEVIIRS